jgi:hypothetical protein
MRTTMSRHPIQPLVLDEHGVIRFKSNAVVRYLLDHGGIDLNRLVTITWEPGDWEQFQQLIGYSHSGAPGQSNEVWETAKAVYDSGASELEARCNYLRDELDALKASLKEPIARLYGVHPDDLKS